MCGSTGGHRLPPMSIEHRTEPRQGVQLAVRLPDGGRAVTRDVSVSGLFLETDRDSQLHELVDLEIELGTNWGRLAFIARAEVVRLEPSAFASGIGVRFLESQLAALDPTP